jgi:lipopolysaccharide biosynthesis glycosyltransferase
MIELCYCANEKVFKGLILSIVSACEKTSDILSVTILTGDFTYLNPSYKPLGEEQANILKKVLALKNPLNKFRVVDGASFIKEKLASSPNLKNSYTPYTFLRLFLNKIPEFPSKILYLDADTIVMKDLAPLFNIDVAGYDFAGVLDAYGRWLINPHYCNSGVLLFNLPESTKNHLFENCLDDLANHRHSFPDQDVLNRYAKGKKLFLPREYNEQTKLRPQTVIRHYCNQPRIFPYVHALIAKPWDIERIHKVYKTRVHDVLYAECESYWEGIL